MRGAVDGSLVPARRRDTAGAPVTIPNLPSDVQPLAPPSKNVPVLDIQDVRVQPIASNSGVGGGSTTTTRAESRCSPAAS